MGTQLEWTIATLVIGHRSGTLEPRLTGLQCNPVRVGEPQSKTSAHETTRSRPGMDAAKQLSLHFQ